MTALWILIVVLGAIAVFLGVLVFGKKRGDEQIILEKTAKIIVLEESFTMVAKKVTELSNELDEEKLRSKAALQLYDESQSKLKTAETKISEFLGILKAHTDRLELNQEDSKRFDKTEGEEND